MPVDSNVESHNQMPMNLVSLKRAPLALNLNFFSTSMITRLVRNYSTKFSSPIDKVLNPIGFIKYKMNLIDNARTTYELCSSQFESNKLTKVLNLEDNFESWFSMTTLHLWMLNKKLSVHDTREFNQELVQHLWLDVEIKLHQAGIRTSISKIIQDLVSSYQGQCLGYDEGLYHGDAVFAASLWRNLLATKDVNPSQLVQALFYIRQNLQSLESTDLDHIVNGHFKFQDFESAKY